MIPLTISQYGDYLSRQFWVDYGQPTRNFNLTTVGNNPNSGVIYYNIAGSNFDPDGITPDRYWMVRESFKLLSATLGISFLETTSIGDEVDFFFIDINPNSAYSYPSGNSYSNGVDYNIINISTNWYRGLSTPNSYTPQTYLHEILHGLGLGHAGNYNYTGTPLSFRTSALFTNDSWSATVMSYWDQTQNPNINSSFSWIKTPMISDWLALDYIYRPQGFSLDNAFVGDTTYGFNTNILDSVSAIWSNFSSYAPYSSYSIVDSQGYDTLDLSGYTQDQLIDLRPSDPNAIYPYYSNVAGLVGNLSIAPNTIIEDAKGGSGNDTFIGNDASNSFQGGNGIDRVKYFKDYSQFTVSSTDTGVTVVDHSNLASVDTVASDIELLEFNDTIMDHRRLWRDQTVFAEYGVTSLDHNWKTIELNNTFKNPVVIVSDPTFNGGQPAAVRITNVTSNSFMMRIQEPLYLDGIHLVENISYFVIESGTWDLGNDMIFSAGTTQTNKLSPQGFAQVNVPVSDIDNIIYSRDNDYQSEPLSVMTQVQTFNGPDWVVTRTDAITGNSFNVTMQEEEARNLGAHVTETIGWVAFNQDTVRTGDVIVDGGTTPTQFNHNRSSYGFDTTFNSSPTLLTKVSSFNGPDTANTRVTNVTNNGFTAFVQEEQSRDLETNHLPESLSYLALSGSYGTLTGTRVDDIFDTQPVIA